MTTDEKQAFVDKMYQDRGYLLDFHKIMAAEDLDFLKSYNQLIEAAYIKPRSLDARTKELLCTVILAAVKANVDHIAAHIKLALEYGCTKKEVLEALEVCVPTAGVPSFMVGFEAWKKVANPDSVESSKP